jgi:hypothetical protein
MNLWPSRNRLTSPPLMNSQKRSQNVSKVVLS